MREANPDYELIKLNYRDLSFGLVVLKCYLVLLSAAGSRGILTNVLKIHLPELLTVIEL